MPPKIALYLLLGCIVIPGVIWIGTLIILTVFPIREGHTEALYSAGMAAIYSIPVCLSITMMIATVQFITHKEMRGYNIGVLIIAVVFLIFYGLAWRAAINIQKELQSDTGIAGDIELLHSEASEDRKLGAECLVSDFRGKEVTPEALDALKKAFEREGVPEVKETMRRALEQLDLCRKSNQAETMGTEHQKENESSPAGGIAPQSSTADVKVAEKSGEDKK